MRLFLSSLRRVAPAGLLSLPLLLLDTGAARAQAPGWQAASLLSQSGSNGSTVMASATDAAGNVYLTGTFTGTVGLGTTTLTSAGDIDVFVAKWNPVSNSFEWAQRAGGSGEDQAAALAVSGGSVYVAGRFAGQAGFGSQSLTSAGSDDGFVVRLTDTGSFGWAQRFGGSTSDYASALTVVGTSLYVGGSFYSPTANFGTLNATNASTSLRADGFVAKLVDAGSSSSFAWVQSVGSTGDDHVMSLAAAGSSVYAAGGFSNTLQLGSTTLQGGALTMFLTKLTDAGPGSSFAWALQSGNGVVIPNALAVSGPNVYVAGRFLFTASFGSTSFTSTGPLNGYDVFVTKVTDAGTAAAFTWALPAGGPASDYVNGVAVSGARVYVVGGYSATASFGSHSLSTTFSSDDVFAAGLTDAGSSGSFAWVQSAGSSGYEQARTVATAPGGKVYVGGTVNSPATFGALTRSSASTASVGFLASFTEQLPTASAAPAWAAGLALYPNPARSSVTLRLPALPAAPTITLTDAVGRAVSTQHLRPVTTEAAVTLALPALRPGLYHLQVQAGRQRVSRPLVVE